MMLPRSVKVDLPGMVNDGWRQHSLIVRSEADQHATSFAFRPANWKETQPTLLGNYIRDGSKRERSMARHLATRTGLCHRRLALLLFVSIVPAVLRAESRNEIRVQVS